MTEIHRTVTSDDRVGLDLVSIPAGSPIDLDLRLEAVSEGVLVTGTVAAETVGQCSRCLEPVTGALNVFLTELFAYPDSETVNTTDDDEVHRLEDNAVDLEQPVIDAVGLDLPMVPLCRDDCPGLCSECGVRLEIAGPDHHHDIIDPRWAALAGMVSADDGADAGPTTPSGDEPVDEGGDSSSERREDNHLR
ncbi:DUF177 domain-containing protein [Gordonia jinhuaensis]|uniref:Metal-binding protein n=2 Tax=Gordonia jinhuaensis TaxID=1517702 RepID=A0A916T699_9ACTN|nr:hypothetical protein GCM10011489_18250 [Gordonia jinhuaensis]